MNSKKGLKYIYQYEYEIKYCPEYTNARQIDIVVGSKIQNLDKRKELYHENLFQMNVHQISRQNLKNS